MSGLKNQLERVKQTNESVRPSPVGDKIFQIDGVIPNVVKNVKEIDAGPIMEGASLIWDITKFFIELFKAPNVSTMKLSGNLKSISEKVFQMETVTLLQKVTKDVGVRLLGTLEMVKLGAPSVLCLNYESSSKFASPTITLIALTVAFQCCGKHRGKVVCDQYLEDDIWRKLLSILLIKLSSEVAYLIAWVYRYSNHRYDKEYLHEILDNDFEVDFLCHLEDVTPQLKKNDEILKSVSRKHHSGYHTQASHELVSNGLILTHRKHDFNIDYWIGQKVEKLHSVFLKLGRPINDLLFGVRFEDSIFTRAAFHNVIETFSGENDTAPEKSMKRRKIDANEDAQEEEEEEQAGDEDTTARDKKSVRQQPQTRRGKLAHQPNQPDKLSSGKKQKVDAIAKPPAEEEEEELSSRKKKRVEENEPSWIKTKRV